MLISRRTIAVALLFTVVVFAAGFGAYWYGRVSNSSEALAERDVRQTIEAVAKLMVLPDGEEPTVATVTDLEQLSAQPFFTNAKIGDRVLIYTKAGKAILYDPVANKIVEAARLGIDVPSSPE